MEKSVNSAANFGARNLFRQTARTGPGNAVFSQAEHRRVQFSYHDGKDFVLDFSREVRTSYSENGLGARTSVRPARWRHRAGRNKFRAPPSSARVSRLSERRGAGARKLPAPPGRRAARDETTPSTPGGARPKSAARAALAPASADAGR